jgi:hypothetical protein
LAGLVGCTIDAVGAGCVVVEAGFVSSESLGGELSAQKSPTVRNRSAPTAGSHIGV